MEVVKSYGKVIKIKYHVDGLEPIKQTNNGEWYDLRCAEDVELKKGDFKLISLGVSIKLPKGYEAILVPRSSTFKNYGILQANSIGVIDNLYCGDDDIWKMAVYATRDIIIHKNDRICQFRIQKTQLPAQIIEVDNMKDKGRGGFGSTGIN